VISIFLIIVLVNILQILLYEEFFS